MTFWNSMFAATDIENVSVICLSIMLKSSTLCLSVLSNTKKNTKSQGSLLKFLLRIGLCVYSPVHLTIYDILWVHIMNESIPYFLTHWYNIYLCNGPSRAILLTYCTLTLFHCIKHTEIVALIQSQAVVTVQDLLAHWKWFSMEQHVKVKVLFALRMCHRLMILKNSICMINICNLQITILCLAVSAHTIPSWKRLGWLNSRKYLHMLLFLMRNNTHSKAALLMSFHFNLLFKIKSRHLFDNQLLK